MRRAFLLARKCLSLFTFSFFLIIPAHAAGKSWLEPDIDGPSSPAQVVVSGANDPSAPRFTFPGVGEAGNVVVFLQQGRAAQTLELKVAEADSGEWTIPATLYTFPSGAATRPAISGNGKVIAAAAEADASGYPIVLFTRLDRVWSAAEDFPFRAASPWVALDQGGETLAFVAGPPARRQVVVSRRNGLAWGDPETVSLPASGPASHPFITPDGKNLVYCQNGRVIAASFDGQAWLSEEVRGSAAAGGELAWPSLSADGSTALFWRVVTRDGKRWKELFGAPRNTGRAHLRRIGGPFPFVETETGPAAVNQEGTLVAFHGEDTLFLSRLENGRFLTSPLERATGASSFPSLSADGSLLVWAGRDPDFSNAAALLADTPDKEPAISLLTPTLNFGEVKLDSPVTKSFTIKNVGKATLKVTKFEFEGGSGGPFVLGKVKLPASISPNKKLSVKVTFTPRELVDSNARLWITSNDPALPVVGEMLAGTGSWPAPALKSISPTEGNEGSQVTLKGSGFGKTASWVQVTVAGGYILNATVRSVSDKSISATLPTGFCAWKTFQEANVWVTVRGVQSGGAHFRLTNLLPCEPSMVLMDPHAGVVGDLVTIKAYGLPADLGKILVSFNGTVTSPETLTPDWDPELTWMTVRVPPGATSGPLRLKRTDGVDRWSQPSDFTILEPTALALAAGAEAGGIVVPVVFFDIGLPSESTQDYGPAPWRLEGANLSKIRASLDHPAGTLNLEVTTSNGTANTELMALGDGTGIVNRPPWALFKGMKAGDTFTVRAWGYELYNSALRRSPWLTLTVGRVLSPGTATAINSTFEFPVRDGRLAMSRGDTLLLAGSTRDATLSAPGLWSGNVVLNLYAHPYALKNGQLFATLVLLDRPGTYTITNHTSGQSILLEVLEAGNNSEYYFNNNAGFAFGEALAREGAILGCGGARLTIPPGALPAYSTGPETTSENYYVSCLHSPEIRPFADDTLGDAGHTLSITFQPTPAELLKPVTIEMPYSLEGRFSPPELGVYDPATGLFFKLTGAEDDGDGHLRLTLPARRYPEDPGKAFAQDPGAGSGSAAVPNTSLDNIVGGVGVYSAKTTNPILRDETRKLVVDYISDSSSSSFVSDAYAQEVFVTAQQTYDLLVAQGWPKPDGWFGGWLTLSIRKPWIWTSQHGSTTSGVFGQPWITINPVKTSQGANLKTTTAHEMGHAFQRQLTTNLTAKWFDEASANAIAWMLLGNQADLGTDISSYPVLPNRTIPPGFYFGYSTDEGYAAGSFAIWMEKNYPKSILKTYEKLNWDPWYWSDSYGTFAEATGASGEMASLVQGWGKWYWNQQENPVAGLDFGHLFPQIADWSGVSIHQSRPPASSDRADVIATDAFAPSLSGKDLVASFQTNGTGQEVTIYGDTHLCSTPPGTLTELAMMNTLTQAAKRLGTYGPYLCYRVVITNYDLSNEAEVTVRIYSPHINSISPSSGNKNGGYPLTISGTGFGVSGANTRVTVEGWNCPVTQWADTSITCTMPALPFTGPHAVQVQTQEFARTNTVTFTAN